MIPEHEPSGVERKAENPSHGPVSRRSFVRGLGASALGFGLAGCRQPGELQPGDGRPDIVLLVLDSLRAKSLEVYGHPRAKAPFLETLASRSTLYERCYAAATWTRPSVSSILTGLPPLEHRGWRFNKAFPADQPSLPVELGKAGYHTGFFTANPAIGAEFGMEEHFDHVAHQAAKESDFGPRLTDDCMDWVRSLTDPGPTFVYIHYWPPHGPYKAPDRFMRASETRPTPGTDHLAHHARGGGEISLAAGVLGRIPWYQAKVDLSRDLVTYQQRYEAHISYADWLAEGFFSQWQKLRGNRRTVFIVTSDHGEALGEHGLYCDHGLVLIDEILHVPLILHDTEAPLPATSGQTVSHLDLAPTILELAGSPNHLGVMNESLLGRTSPGRVVISQEGKEGSESGWALTSDRWRLTYNGGATFGSGHLMEVRAADPAAPSVTGTPLPVPANSLRWPVQIADGMVLESFAFHNRALSRASGERFSGTLRSGTDGERLVLRVRTAGSKPAAVGLFPEGDFEGELPDFPVGFGDRLIVEGARWRDTGPEPPDSGWLRVLTAEVVNPRRLNKVMEIAAVKVEPPVARPGDAVRITLRWRAHDDVEKEIGTIVELIDPNDRVVISEARTFFRRVPEKGTEPRPLIESWDLEKTTFAGRPLDFEDSFWWTVPAESHRGIHHLRVGLVDYSELFWGKRIVPLADPVPMAELEICESRSAGLRAHDRLQLGIESLRLPPGSRLEPAERGLLMTLAKRFPDQGHFDFLLSRHAATEVEQRELLRRCLLKTPFHRMACSELAAIGDQNAAGVVASLTPQHHAPTRFGDLISLSGFDLHRGDSCVYLTLYWEAEAVSTHTFTAKLAAKMIPGSGKPTERWIWWFIGGAQRPTHAWKIGETVIETIRLEIEPEAVDFSLQLRLAERWQTLFSRNRGPFVVTSGNDDQRAVVVAELGSHRADDLPRCDRDFLARKRSDPAQCVLVDLDEDPDQKTNLVHSRPEVFDRLQRHLIELLDASDSWGQRNEGADIELSEETVEQLRALGYLD